MITPDVAWGIVLEQTRPLESIAVSLADALGYCLAEDVRADRDLPPADRSAMDGYAARHADLQQRPCVLSVIGEVAAGSPHRPRVKPGTCARIFTGANVPPGADTVVMVEQTEECDGSVTIRSSVAQGANILRRAEDARKGVVLLPRGTRMDAARVGVCALVGSATVKVHRQPSVTILCTGSELRSVHDRVRPHEIRNSSGPALCAALSQWGVAGTKFFSVADRHAALLVALHRALKRHDVVLLTGGVSVGKYDFVRDAIEAAGATIRFHGLAMKPGKPALYATAPVNRHVFGLPGNPLSALTAFHEFALPALRRLAGHPAETCRPSWLLPLAEGVESKAGRVRYELARLVNRESGLAVAPTPSQSSADLVSAGHADGVAVLPPDRPRFASGEFVVFRPWKPLP
jgi:molybdopterin molybdotransferase